ncbi:unnamed protein product [Rhizoctonia solani]|uniref:Uncharacterized protein n=1 Tax=Rhizoctonia solani TaxID=456999 RepID=A0A8H3DSG3_9AGAM|nr:unnamed protein product [Rhizoctonia solani]
MFSLPWPESYTLNPIVPSDFDRFTPVSCVKIDNKLELVSALSDSAGNHLARSSIAESTHGFSQSTGTIVHPEGSPISYRSCIVSTQNITDAHVSAEGLILDQCEIPSKSAEIAVFLYIVGHQVDHYVVDHESKAIIWAAGKVPESFKGAIRAKHEHEYWIYMENFPGLRFSTPEDLRLLKEVLASNAIDVLNSEGSTSPMSVQQIQTHLKSLESFSSSGDVHQTYSVARLWNLFLHSRVINKYVSSSGAELPGNFQTIAENPPVFTRYSVGPGSSHATLRSLGRQTLDGLKRVMNSTGILPGLSQIAGTFEKLQNEIEEQEARLQCHLDALSSIIEAYVQRDPNVRSHNSHSLLEFHSLITTVHNTLSGHTSNVKPYSYLLDAKKHQQRFEKTADTFRNWTNEWIVRSITGLEQKFDGLESRLRGLDNRIQGLNKLMKRNMLI